MHRFRATDLPFILTRWAERHRVFAPAGVPGNVRFRSWPPDGQTGGQAGAKTDPMTSHPTRHGEERDETPDASGERFLTPDEYVNVSLSPKSFVFNERETLFRWRGGEKTCTATGEPRPAGQAGDTLLFGVRPCDVAGLGYLDRFFLGEHADINYHARRQHVLTVAVNCLKAGPLCFCASFGAGPFAPSPAGANLTGTTGEMTYDLLLTPDTAGGETCYWVEVGTARGRVLLGDVTAWLHRDVEGRGAARRETLEAAARRTLARSVDAEALPSLLAAHFNNPVWETTAAACIGCTGCTRVCPTCTCFTTEEESDGPRSGVRTRVWDSCQSVSFTRNAERHNPRSRAAAVRYRIHDKFKYIQERFGHAGCTGCGRCTACCPAGIDMVKLVNGLTDEDAAGLSPLPDAASLVHFSREERLFDPRMYTPLIAEITDIHEEARDIRRFTVSCRDRPEQGRPALRGQFFMLTVFGVGESAISVPFSARVRDGFTFYVKKVGTVTAALHKLKVGDVIGLRGPFGVPLPYETLKGRDLLAVGSGVGLAPVRAALIRAIENRQEFGRIVVMASATTYDGLILKEDLERWKEDADVEVHYALSRPTDKVRAHIGYVNDLLPDLGLEWGKTSAIVCASARRIKAVARDLLRLGMRPSDIYTTLETNMRCGVGKCGHCKVGAHYMCVDGPVFTYAEMLALPPEF